jgi:hypothetical protein
MHDFIRVAHVIPMAAWTVQLTFTNGEQRIVDLTPYIATGPIYAPLRADPETFRAVYVDGGTVVWPNGADIDPDVLYFGGLPPWSQAEGQAAATPGSQQPPPSSKV